MNWYLQSGKDSDIAISTRIRFVRNINGLKFNLKKQEEVKKLDEKIKDNLYNIGYGLKFFKIKDMDNNTKLSLVEKNLISPDFIVNNLLSGGILINDEENICITTAQEDNLKIQVFNSGIDLENTLNLAIEIDKKLEEIFGYCINKKYGYLTSCPSDLGTGLRASVMLHLPALSITKNVNPLLEALSNFGINIRGIFGKSTPSMGNIYQISNKQTLGVTENEIIRNLEIIVQKIIEQERKVRKILADNSVKLADNIYRAYGILSNCRKLSYKESVNLLSMVKLGVDLGILKEINDLKIQKLYLYTKNANMQKYYAEEFDDNQLDIKRAEIVRKIISEK